MRKSTISLFLFFLFVFQDAVASDGFNDRDSSRSGDPGRESRFSVRKISDVRKRFEPKRKYNFITYIENQSAGAQAGSFWIDGNGVIGGNFTIGRPYYPGAGVGNTAPKLFISYDGINTPLLSFGYYNTGYSTFSINAGGSVFWNTTGATDLQINGTTGTGIVVKPNSNVQIGTTTDAGYKLDVNGAIRSNQGSDGWLHFGANAQNAIYGSSANNLLVFYTAQTERLRIAASGNLLAGNVSDAGDYRLQLTGGLLLNGQASEPSGVNGGIVYNSTTNQFKGYRNGQWKTFLMEGDASSGSSSVWSLNGNNISYSLGNVGIGTTSPNQKLEVAGSNAGGEIALRINNYGGAVGDIAKLEFADQGPYVVRGHIYTKIRPGGNSDMFFGTFSTVGMTDRMILTSEGNVGIGTISPTRQLDVIGSPIFQSSTVNGSFRMKPSSSSFNASSQIVDLYENYDVSNSAVGVIGLANSNWAAPLPSFAFVSTKNGTGSAKNMMFWANDNPSGINAALTIKANTGNIGIGTIGARKIKVTQAAWADYVFHPTYQLPTLKEVEAFIKQHNHLPDVPSASEVAEKGLDVGDNQVILLKKIEELTLYIIEQDKTINAQNQKIESQQGEIKELKNTSRRIEELSSEIEKLKSLVSGNKN